jgi:ribosomal protein S27E
MDKLTLSLIENSFDYLESSIKYSKGTENRDWKYALLNLASAIELMMKAVLEQEHWSLLFEDIKKANKDILSQGDFKSVNFETAIERIKSIVGISFSHAEERYVEKIRQKRNRITHFSVELHIEEVKSIVAKGIGIFIKLYRKIDTAENVEDKLHYINSELLGFQKYVKLRLAEIEKEISGMQRPDIFLTCPSCLQETIVIDTKFDELCCKFCGAEFSYKDMASFASDGYFGPCPECSNGALAYLSQASEFGEYICTKCGFTSEDNYNIVCSSCGNIYWDENGGESYLCETCHDSIYN